MKRFICILFMALLTAMAWGQYNERGQFIVKSLNQEQEIQELSEWKANAEKWEEWKGAQTKIAQGKAFMWTGVAVGTITSGVCLSIISNNKRLINEGTLYYDKSWDDGSNVHISYDTINRRVSAVMWTIDAISIAAAVYGIYKRAQGRSELDKIYSRVYFNGRSVAVSF